jgi:hypothetical protein
MTAGSFVQITNDVGVDPGGELTIGLDPTLQALGPLSEAFQGRSVRHLLSEDDRPPPGSR